MENPIGRFRDIQPGDLITVAYSLFTYVGIFKSYNGKRLYYYSLTQTEGIPTWYIRENIGYRVAKIHLEDLNDEYKEAYFKLKEQIDEQK